MGILKLLTADFNKIQATPKMVAFKGYGEYYWLTQALIILNKEMESYSYNGLLKEIKSQLETSLRKEDYKNNIITAAIHGPYEADRQGEPTWIKNPKVAKAYKDLVEKEAEVNQQIESFMNILKEDGIQVEKHFVSDRELRPVWVISVSFTPLPMEQRPSYDVSDNT